MYNFYREFPCPSQQIFDTPTASPAAVDLGAQVNDAFHSQIFILKMPPKINHEPAQAF